MVLRRLWRLLAVALGLGVAAALTLALAFYIQYSRDDRPIVLPLPRGPHLVGRMLRDWVDSRRNRRLMVFLWYPVQRGASGPRSEYIPGKWGEIEAKKMFPIPARRYQEIQVSAIENAPVAAGAMPVLLLLPGMGRIPAHYTTLVEDLASFGYLIAGVTPTGFSRPVVFSDGSVDEGKEDWNLDNGAAAQDLIKTWVADASFALDQLTRDSRFADRVQLNKAGIFGHSFGGISSVHALRLDRRFVRAANLDGGFFGEPINRLDRPLLILEAGATVESEARRVCDLDHAGCVAAAFPHAQHMNFSDAGVLPSRFPFPKSLLMLGNVDGQQFLREVSDRLRAFFDQM